MTLEEIIRQIHGEGKSAEEQTRILRKNRADLLEEIHRKQQLLDRLDYMIYEINKNGSGT